MKIPADEATTAQLGAVYPCVATRALPADAVFVGRDVFGGPFVYDPFLLYAAGALTNPNMVVLGQIGRGKSAFVKSYLLRQAALGRRVVVLDPKGEYGPFARSLESTPIALRPGGTHRLNPLDGIVDTGRSAVLASLSLIAELAAACLGRALLPAEHAAVELALASTARGVRLTLPAVVAALLEPEAASAREIRCSVEDLQADGRQIALELRRFVSGEFLGMFDGETSVGINLHARVVVVDLSAIYHSSALGAALTCVSAAMQSAWRSSSPDKTFFVVDEAWAILQNAAATRFLQSSLKLARARGIANLIVVHRASDFFASGSEGSVVARIAEGLVADCETLVCFAQADAELRGNTAAVRTFRR